MEFVVCAGVILVGALVQGSIGFGLNLLSAPFVALVVPEALPATLVLVALPSAIANAAREPHAMNRVALPWMLAGALPGTVLGLLVVTAVDASSLATLVGAITLTGVALSLLSPPVPVTSGTSFVAGFISNIFGTAAAVGGPPVALLLQRATGPTARSTLGVFFAVSALMSIVGYVVADKVTGDHLLFALALVPFMAAGLWSSKHLHQFVDGGWLRPSVLALSAIAGVAAIVNGLT
jgi:uncharacterized membrane protein YfcA